MRLTLVLALACLAAGCRPRPPVPATPPAPDSIVLERTRCFGICPAYRLSLARSGAVRFRSLNPGDSTRTASDTLPRGAFERLARQAAELGFDALPDRIAGSELCGTMATDHPSAIVTLFRGARAKRVEDYHGCYPGPAALRRFELAVDSTARSERWVRDARVR